MSFSVVVYLTGHKGHSKYEQHLNVSLSSVALCQMTTVWLHAFFMSPQLIEIHNPDLHSLIKSSPEMCKQIATLSETEMFHCK